MKKLIVVMMVMVMMVVCIGAQAETIERVGVVVALDWIDCTMKVLTEDGNVWEMDLDDEWYIGDVVVLIMNDQETEEVEDDEVIEMHYIESLEDYNTVQYIDSFMD